MHSTTTRLGRRAFGLALLGTLALSACGTDEAASFDTGDGGSDGGGASDGGSDENAGGADNAILANLPRLDAGFLVTDFTKDITVTATLQPTKNTVITPTGTLSIGTLQEVATVAADAVGLEAELDEDGEVLDFAAADGEVLRAMDLTFTPFDEDAWMSGESEPVTDLSIRASGSQSHLAELTGRYEDRILVSVPEDGSGVLVVSCEGHDQLLDLSTGEREEDEIAAAYYRSNRIQELHHTFPVSVKSIPVLYGGGADSEITPEISLRATSLSLTAWTKQTGWADAGGAWLVLNWTSECGIATEVPGVVDKKEYSAVATMEAGGESSTDKVTRDSVNFAPSSTKDESTLVMPVPVDLAAATLSMSGTLTISMDAARGSYAMDASGDLTFSSEPLTVEFTEDSGASSPEPSDSGS